MNRVDDRRVESAKKLADVMGKCMKIKVNGVEQPKSGFTIGEVASGVKVLDKVKSIIKRRRRLRLLVFVPFAVITILCFKFLILPIPPEWFGVWKMVLGWFIWTLAVEFYIDGRKWVERQ
jgi:hypothetical protein